MDSFEKRLESLREKSNLKKKDISSKLGFSPNVYGAYERGERRPSFETIIKLANLFDVTIDYLLKGTLPKSLSDQENFESNLMKILKRYNISDISLLDINKWETLSKSDIEEINHHFQWVVTRANKFDAKK